MAGAAGAVAAGICIPGLAGAFAAAGAVAAGAPGMAGAAGAVAAGICIPGVAGAVAAGIPGMAGMLMLLHAASANAPATRAVTGTSRRAYIAISRERVGPSTRRRGPAAPMIGAQDRPQKRYLT